MALYPGAVKKLIRPGTNDPPITPLGVILHTDAGDSASLYNYFNGPSGGIESHFHIPKSKPVEQYRDTGYEADANLKANSFFVNGKRFGFLSVETQGLASDPWNAYQLAEIKKLILWAKSVHPAIMLRVCPSPTSAGIGYHTLFGSPSEWTPVAKSCPGPVRIKQFNDVLVPWMKTLTAPPTTPSGGLTMADADSIETMLKAEAYRTLLRYQRAEQVAKAQSDLIKASAAATVAALSALSDQMKAEDAEDDAVLQMLIKTVNDNVDALETVIKTPPVVEAPKA